MEIRYSEAIKKLPPYLFAKLDEEKEKAKQKWDEVIPLGIGDPDIGTPQPIIEELYRSAMNKENHRYPSYTGMIEFREAVAKWYEKRFGVRLDPAKEVLSLIGSKEGIAHIPLAFINSGDVVLYTNPGYPVYSSSTIIAGGEPYPLPLIGENNFFPQLDNIPADILGRAKLMFVNYPNNPTSRLANRNELEAIVDFAKRHNIIICYDNAYSEIYFDKKPPSILEVPGAMDIAVEFGSLSKTFNMTGWRIGYVVGNRDIIAGLGKIKTNIDSGIFQAVQYAGIKAFEIAEDFIPKNIAIFKERRDIAVEYLKDMGFDFDIPKATFYIWARVPDGYTSQDFVMRVINEAGVVITPGNGFGDYGEGYFRIALTVDRGRLIRAMERIKKIRL